MPEKTPQREISENMLRAMRYLIADGKAKNRVEIARRIGMSQNSIYRIEKNDSFAFTLEQFCRLCQEYEISPAELFPKK